ncbi:hypothetical protein KUTeg_012332 [Tegillarca granosa]|uniref:Disease resistance R13L4/SHOC-2-like LRR domain-containing protein n=1 Tax=Tegillarca granosa TaxID=220873 RepID=A0ABQ9F3J6_TEGGR|nr:hypothetical protein KUTeg_012332 [Tegillarca granosa]
MPIDFPYLYRLRVLKAAGNDLKSLPNDVDKLKSLEVLDLSDNIIESLPEKICKIPTLKELDVSDNKIMLGFPKAWENLRQKATVRAAEQSSSKKREPRDRPVKESQTQVSPKGGKKAIGKKKGVAPVATPPATVKTNAGPKSAPPRSS